MTLLIGFLFGIAFMAAVDAMVVLTKIARPGLSHCVHRKLDPNCMSGREFAVGGLADALTEMTGRRPQVDNQNSVLYCCRCDKIMRFSAPWDWMNRMRLSVTRCPRFDIAKDAVNKLMNEESKHA